MRAGDRVTLLDADSPDREFGIEFVGSDLLYGERLFEFYQEKHKEDGCYGFFREEFVLVTNHSAKLRRWLRRVVRERKSIISVL
jgi:hypothetical protein